MGAGSVSDLVRIVEEGLAETLSGQPGFVGYHVITSGADEVVSVSIFDDEDCAVRSNQLASEFVHDRLQQFQLNLTGSDNISVLGNKFKWLGTNGAGGISVYNCASLVISQVQKGSSRLLAFS